MHLTVREAFTLKGDEHTEPREFQRGDKIFDAEMIETVMESENAGHVVRTANGTNLN